MDIMNIHRSTNSNKILSFFTAAPPLPLVAKKNSSRRNAWGNLSYADLITQAITSSQDNRLTLSQIYEWMVQNVPYFKDKGDSNSSAGWKVSPSSYLYLLFDAISLLLTSSNVGATKTPIFLECLFFISCFLLNVV